MILLKFLKIKYKLLCKRSCKLHRKKPIKLSQIQANLTKGNYQILNPTWSSRCKFQWTAVSHILSNDAIDDLQLELIISNVNVATYEIVDYLDKRLWPIGQPEYSLK